MTDNNSTTALTASVVLAGLGTSVLPRAVRCYGQVGSTMDLAREWIQDEPERAPLLVTAEEQTAGRGRRGRPWVAPAGSALLFSLALQPRNLPAAHSQALIWMAGVALCEGIAAATGVGVRLKWPNDLIVPTERSADASLVAPPPWRKLGGILLEASFSGDALAWAILGCGVNVGASPPDDPGMRYPATSLAALGRPLERLVLLQAMLRRLDHWYGVLEQGERALLYRAWRAQLATLGHPVRVETAEGRVEGRAEDVDESGALHVRDAAGQLHIISNGDVS